MRCIRLGRLEFLSEDMCREVDGEIKHIFEVPTSPNHVGGWNEKLRQEGIDPRGWRVPTIGELRFFGELFVLGVGGVKGASDSSTHTYWSWTPVPLTNNKEYEVMTFGLRARDRGRMYSSFSDPIFNGYFHHIRPVRDI